MVKRIIAIAASAALLAGPGAATAAAPAKDNIVETAVKAGDFKTLVKLVKDAGLAGTLSGKTNYTVFAPTDAAFAKVPKATLNALANDRALLRKVLLYHVLPGKRSAASLVKAPNPVTAEGKRVKVTLKGKKAFVNGVRILQTDIRTSNGIIHPINAVLTPPGLYDRS